MAGRIAPIRTEADYEAALGEIGRYFENQPEPGTPEGDRFDVLSILVERYEQDHFPIPDPDPIEMIKAYMELHGLKQSALSSVIGSRSRASEVLNRKRPLTMDMAFRINANGASRPKRLSGPITCRRDGAYRLNIRSPPPSRPPARGGK